MAENTVTMEIIDSEQYKRANIRFIGKPSEEIREELKKEGWFYSRNHNVWYPKNDAAAKSRNFAQHIRDTYFPTQKEEIKIITEATEKDELQVMIQNGSSLKDILSKLSDMYGENAVHEAFNEVKQNIDSAVEEKPEVEAELTEEEEIEEDSPATTESTITEDNLYPDDVNSAKTKLGDIVRETFLTLSEEEKEAGTTTEQKNTRYEKWYRPMIDEIMASVTAGDQDLIRKINDFDLNKASHKEGNSYYSEDEAFKRDVNYKLLPELYEIVQDKIRKEYDEKKIPYIVMFSSESPVFPTENKVYTVKEFNELLLKADSEFHNRREYAEKKYGSADNYWELESEDKLPEEDKGIQFGYDKTNFKFFNIPNPANPEDTFSYEPSRYDIGDGNGSVFDYVRSTCSHDEFIEALNQLEKDLYFPEVTKTQREDIDKIVAKEAKKLSKNLTEKLSAVDEAQEEYKELHKKWLIESSEAEAADKKLEDALSGVKAVYDKAMSDAFGKILNEYPYASIKSIEDSQLLQYAANEVKKMAVNELYLPSRNAQKAMNAEDYASYNSTDWAKLRKIWALFPANVNMDSYARDLLNKTIEQRNEKANTRPAEEVHDEKKPSTELTVEDLEICKKVIPPSQYNFTLELTKGEEGDFYKGKLKEIAETYRKINTDNELVNEDGTHNVGFRYFLGNTEIYISEIDSEGIGFGYNILNGDLQMSEWGSTSMDEILSIPFIEMDYHVDKDATIEEMLYKGHQEYFKEFAPKADEKAYTAETSNEQESQEPPLTVYTFSPFGYEGSLVTVETDLRRGIPAYDIVGIADSTVKESRERIRAAFKNSGLELPAERILQSLSPADLRKDSPMDVAMAVDILARKEDWRGEPVLALGELELSGNIRPTRGAHAAVTTARAAGISNIICDKTTAELLKDIHGIKILAVENLKEISEKINDKANFIETKPEVKKDNEIEFNEDYFDAAKESLANYDLKGHFDSIRAIEIAVAGKHNILQVGAPGCGKTLLQQNLIPALTPKLTEDEALSISRINSIAGLDSPNHDKLLAPFRMPHQTASIEGICGGGPNCRPGEISLAHKGTLFLDEAAEFRSSVLQMLRVPLETKSITLSRAGRTTVYPADFQLAMATNPCPCGCYGSKDKICLDSAKSIDLYWKKFSAPLIDRIEIKNFVQRDEKDERTISLEEMREQVRKAYEIQRKRGVYNSHLTPEQIDEYCKLSEPCEKYVNGIEDLSPRSRANLLKLSLTIANMDGREEILMNDLLEARELSAPMFEKPNQFKYQPENTIPVAEVQNADFRIDDETISKSQIDAAIRERKLITEPVLNGEKTGLYKAFKDFEDKGVFDVQGTQVKLSKNGGLTPTGWKQLQAAMEIYRSKKFETFRYVMIDRKTGEIADQLAITSHMPNFCNVTLPNDETLKQVISRAEEKDYLIAVCHNHPSGNTTESSFDRELTDSLDRSLRRNDGLNRFAGHIILDHDTFNLAVPNETPGKCHWKKMEPVNVEKEDRLNAEHSPSFADQSVSGTGALKEVAEKINDTENWNDNFIPVVFTNADRNITGVQYYSKNFFENESDKIRNEFQFSAMEAGAIGAFPIITDSLWNKLPEEARTSLETKLKDHIMNDAFTDAAFNKSTITEKYSIEAGRNYYSFNRDSSDRKIDVVSTWTPEVNPRLFPEEHKKQNHDIER
ncbi:Mg chelatase-related protein [Treponema bryantii]|uniref:Mg chelatase-related protein n=1 Tax=Treponema bryantii TaxID=163 RepID=A0A1I3LWL5_9SPIR|nr:YifB family Mg chelatase-like AAA ATPase [Treponema bryantii]SFI89083.1 Mg chelatase-related protein [Treponema bryantii]